LARAWNQILVVMDGEAVQMTQDAPMICSVFTALATSFLMVKQIVVKTLQFSLKRFQKIPYIGSDF